MSIKQPQPNREKTMNDQELKRFYSEAAKMKKPKKADIVEAIDTFARVDVGDNAPLANLAIKQRSNAR